MIEWVGKRVTDGMSFCDADMKRAALRCAQVILKIRAEAALAVGVVLSEREREDRGE